MQIFKEMAAFRHDQLAFWSEPAAGYRGIIAIHDTTLGPALGGTRLWKYASETDALADALRLARGMTYKAALAGLNLGGGKSVILADGRPRDRERLFRAHGRAVESLGGRYITAEDVGTSVDDMEFVRAETRWVVGVRGGSGDPSPATAHGVYQGIRACAQERYGDPCLEGRHVTVQGVGHVGYHLCAELAAEGARLTVADIDADSVQRAVDNFGATAVRPERDLRGGRRHFRPLRPGRGGQRPDGRDSCAWTLWRAPPIISWPNRGMAAPFRSGASCSLPTT